MKEQHILDILDNTQFEALSADELTMIREHNADCGDCRSAFGAARFASAMLKFDSEENIFEPTPFFQTKVMAAIREQRATGRNIWDFWRIWQASGSLVGAMVLLVAGLMFATILAPSSSAGSDIMAIADESEAIVFEQEVTLRDMNSEQVFPVIFER